MRQSAFEFRFQVYCPECRFLEARDDPDSRDPDSRETDACDEDAAHFYSGNPRRELVGYVRLVRPDPNERFPWEEHCADPVNGVPIPARVQSAEISRLMLRTDHQRRRTDAVALSTFESDGAVGPGERRSGSPRVLLDLYRQMYRYSLESDIRCGYAAMEGRLAKLLQRLNFGFLQIGMETDHFGPLAPYLTDLREVESRLDATNPALLAWMQKPAVNDH
jgi:N-acyl amino acid synthase of PEP-CTERM/exosortase system